MKISRRQLRNLINETINESTSDDSRVAGMNATIASIEKQYGNNEPGNKRVFIDSGSPSEMTKKWIKLVMNNAVHQKTLLHVWDHLIDGDDPAATKQIYLNDLKNDEGIAKAILYYGRQINNWKNNPANRGKGENYPTGDMIEVMVSEKIKTKDANKVAAANAPKQPWRRPDYGMGTRIDPDTGEKIPWTGKLERFN